MFVLCHSYKQVDYCICIYTNNKIVMFKKKCYFKYIYIFFLHKNSGICSNFYIQLLSLTMNIPSIKFNCTTFKFINVNKCF